MASFKDKCLVEYPIPIQFSIWGGNGEDVQPVEDLDKLIATCIDELKSDILITEYISAVGMWTQLPQDTISCRYAKLDGMAFPFQGNRLIKVSFDKSTKIAYLRYYPAVVTYQRYLRLSDCDDMVGDRLVYCKAYTLWKMSEKELQIMKGARMTLDNGELDFSVLQEFSNTMHSRYNDLKPEILLYNTVN